MKFNRRSFLTGAAATTALASLPLIARGGGSPKKLILVFASGGWDVTYGFDPKLGSMSVDGPETESGPGASEEAVGTWGDDLSFMVNDVKRPNVSLFLDNWSHLAAVVNGIWVGTIAHSACSVRMLTGTRTETSADIAAISGYALAGKDENIPIPYMDVGGRAFMGELAAYSGRAGFRNQLKALLQPEMSLPSPPGSGIEYPLMNIQAGEAGLIDSFLATRAQRLLGAQTDPADARQVADYFQATDRAQALLQDGTEFADELEFGASLSLSAQADAAVGLLRSGLCQTVSLDSRQLWDSHDDISEQHNSYNNLFAGLDGLMSKLQSENLLSETVVVVMSEMTRTPKRNSGGGKDHWPQTSAMVLGAGVVGGRTFGASDEALNAAPVDLASGQASSTGQSARYDHFAAGVLQLLDVDSQDWFPGLETYSAFIA